MTPQHGDHRDAAWLRERIADNRKQVEALHDKRLLMEGELAGLEGDDTPLWWYATCRVTLDLGDDVRGGVPGLTMTKRVIDVENSRGGSWTA